MLVKRSFTLAGHRTSVALEPEFWQALSDIARDDGLTLTRLVAEIDAHRAEAQALASQLRVVALKRHRVPDAAHTRM